MLWDDLTLLVRRAIVNGVVSDERSTPGPRAAAEGLKLAPNRQGVEDEAALAESQGQVSEPNQHGDETRFASAHARLENQAFGNKQKSVQSPTRHLKRSTVFEDVHFPKQLLKAEIGSGEGLPPPLIPGCRQTGSNGAVGFTR